MKLFLFATLLEAQKTLDSCRAAPIATNLYSVEEHRIGITGMGTHAALGAVMRWGAPASHIYNLGFAGALDRTLELGAFYQIEEVSKNLSLPTGLDERSRTLAASTHPPLALSTTPLKFALKRLLSSDYPLFCDELSERYRGFDLVDMEGYGVVYGAKLLNKPCTLLKVVSDFASSKGRETMREQIENLSAALRTITLTLC